MNHVVNCKCCDFEEQKFGWRTSPLSTKQCQSFLVSHFSSRLLRPCWGLHKSEQDASFGIVEWLDGRLWTVKTRLLRPCWTRRWEWEKWSEDLRGGVLLGRLGFHNDAASFYVDCKSRRPLQEQSTDRSNEARATYTQTVSSTWRRVGAWQFKFKTFCLVTWAVRSLFHCGCSVKDEVFVHVTKAPAMQVVRTITGSRDLQITNQIKFLIFEDTKITIL